MKHTCLVSLLVGRVFIDGSCALRSSRRKFHGMGMSPGAPTILRSMHFGKPSAILVISMERISWLSIGSEGKLDRVPGLSWPNWWGLGLMFLLWRVYHIRAAKQATKTIQLSWWHSRSCGRDC